MKQHAIISTLFTLLLASTSPAWAQQGFKSSPVFKASTTVIGQPIQFPKTEKPEMATYLVEIAPGGESGWHKHAAPLYIHILEGALTMDVEGHEGKKFSFTSGNGFIEAIEVWHNGHNVGDVPLKFLAVYVKDADTPGIVWKNKK